MNKRALFFLLAIFVGVSELAYSQSSVNNLAVEFKLDEQAGTLVPNVIFTIGTSGMTGVEKVLITLGSSDNGTEFFSYTINLDGSDLPQGVTVQTQGNNIVINTGNRSGIIQYYASAKLQYAGGTFSEIKKVNNAN